MAIETLKANKSLKATGTGHAHKLPWNVDVLAIGIALTLAALIRFGVIHAVKF